MAISAGKRENKGVYGKQLRFDNKIFIKEVQVSNQIKISFPDSSVKEYKSGISSLEIAKSISNSLAKKILVASFNDVHIDLSTELTENGSIKFFTWDDIEGKKTFWHSSAHLLAEAVESLYPGVKFGIGPPIDNGFYYDIDFMEYDSS